MAHIRQLLLAFLLAFSLAPAFAQAPPPVPALPDAERRTSYVVTGSTCNCAVGFALYGDSTDYANWLEVWVNGQQLSQVGNWTITSPTGSLATIPRPITNAVLTFTTAQTGTVQIVGARRPRRTSQFSESRGVAARDLNQVLSDLTAQNREVWDKTNDVTGRAVLAPPGETLAVLPKLSSRMNQGACFNTGGNLVPCVSVPGSTFTAGNGITLTGVSPTVIANNIAAGTGITLTGTNPITISTAAQSFGSKSFGAVCDGVADDTAALSAWIAAINGSSAASVYGELGPGACRISSTTLSTGLVITRSNVTIDGRGASITVTGASMMNEVFSSNDQSHIRYRNISFVGNSVATTFALGGAIGFTNSTVNILDLLVEDCAFTNFQGDYWIYVETLGAFNNSIQNVNINRNYFLSANGNARGPTQIAISSAFVLVYGVGNNSGPLTPNSFVQQVHITNNVMRAEYIKNGIIAFHNVQDVTITGNQIYGAGQLGGIVNDTGAYAILVYENGSPYSKHSIIANNYIFNARDNCIYMAGQWTNSVIDANVCDTQTSTAVATLPKGGISINGGIATGVTNNRLVNIAADGITLVAPVGSVVGEWLISGNYVNASLDGIKLLNGSGGNAQKVTVVNNNVLNPSTAVGIIVYVFPGQAYTDLKIDGNNISGGTYGIRLIADTGSLTLNNVSVSRNLVQVPTSYGIDIAQVAAGGPILLDGNMVSGAPTNASFNITNTVNAVFQNNVCSLQTVGACWTSAGAQGTMQNNSFDRVPNANIVASIGALDLGRVKPTWTPAGTGAGAIVQNLLPAEAGAAASKYVIREWFYNIGTVAWLDQRLLTGN